MGIALSASAGFAAEPTKIRADWSVLPGQFAALIPSVPQYGPNVYRDYGKTYVVEPIKLTGGTTAYATSIGRYIELSFSKKF